MSASPAEIPRAEGAESPSQLFVINLCASTSPMALAQPNVPALKRYTFFVSRQRDDGRDRFRLHMGYFASQDEAEKLLDVVRDIYPAAWTGPAPASGAPRRNRAAVTPAPIVAVAKAQPMSDVLGAMSNVREVLANLDSVPAPRMETEVDAGQPALEENEVLRVLEASAKSVAETGKFLSPSQAQVRLITHADTQTLPVIQEGADNAPQCFAVQLLWSVSPIDVARLPHLAIFDAYTLYNVEGNRDGRKWYGVRLGFFSDSTAANQVANYIRSDYRSVAIVPVADKERDGAGGGMGKNLKAAAQQGDAPKPVLQPVGRAAAQPAPGADNLEGFQLLEDDRPVAAKLDFDDKPSATVGMTVPVAKPIASPAAKTAVKPTSAVKPVNAAKQVSKEPGKPAGKPVGKRVVVRKRPPTRPGAPTPLDSTLELLGASTLSLEDTRAIINDSAVRKPLDRKRGGRFAKLLGRLSGNQEAPR